MTADRAILTALRDRLRTATGPGRGLDGRIAWALGWRFNGFAKGIDDPDFDQWEEFGGGWKQPGDDKFFSDLSVTVVERRAGEKSGRWEPPPKWTASIDAALALVEKVLPGVFWLVGFGKTRKDEPPYGAQLLFGTDEVIGQGEHVTPPLAILLALVEALIAKEAAHVG